MSTKHFCDDCEKELKFERLIRFHTFNNHPLREIEMCYDCFDKHWKPLQKKFSIKGKYAH